MIVIAATGTETVIVRSGKTANGIEATRTEGTVAIALEKESEMPIGQGMTIAIGIDNGTIARRATAGQRRMTGLTGEKTEAMIPVTAIAGNWYA